MAAASSVSVIGEEHLVEGLRLAGAVVHVAEDAEGARRAWDALGDDAGIVLLTPGAAEAIGQAAGGSGVRMTAVLPQ